MTDVVTFLELFQSLLYYVPDGSDDNNLVQTAQVTLDSIVYLIKGHWSLGCAVVSSLTADPSSFKVVILYQITTLT